MSKAENPNSQTPVTIFEVDSYGTLEMSNFEEPTTRAEFYESVSDYWSRSPAHLVDAMDECQPLSWVVNSIYTEIRDEILASIDDADEAAWMSKKRSAALEARLKAMPEDPESGAEGWLLSLTDIEFEQRIVPEIEKWFESPPDWNWEDDYLPRNETAQGAALEFFQFMDQDDLDLIGVVIVEGEHPGSTYYAAELKVGIEVANKASVDNGIPVRFHLRNIERK